MALPHDIEAEIHFLPTDRGGKDCVVVSGYRPQFFYRNQDWDAQHTYIDRDQVAPGESTRAYLTFLSPELHVGHVFEGMPFLVREGQRVVAYGRVLRIIDLDESARRSQAAGGHRGFSPAAA